MPYRDAGPYKELQSQLAVLQARVTTLEEGVPSCINGKTHRFRRYLVHVDSYYKKLYSHNCRRCGMPLAMDRKQGQ